MGPRIRVVQDKQTGTLTVFWGNPDEGSSSEVVSSPGVRGHLVLDLDRQGAPIGIEIVDFRPANPDEDIVVETVIVPREEDEVRVVVRKAAA